MFTIDDLYKDSTVWEFKDMEVGDLVHYSFSDNMEKARTSQRQAHVYGHSSGKKFKTRKVKKDGVEYMVVARIS